MSPFVQAGVSNFPALAPSPSGKALIEAATLPPESAVRRTPSRRVSERVGLVVLALERARDVGPVELAATATESLAAAADKPAVSESQHELDVKLVAECPSSGKAVASCELPAPDAASSAPVGSASWPGADGATSSGHSGSGASRRGNRQLPRGKTRRFRLRARRSRRQLRG
jgi:hypothetical protein